MNSSFFGFRSSALLALPFAVAFVPLASGACGGVQQAVLSSETGDGGSDASAAQASPEAAVTIEPASCKLPQDCNADPAVSALWGDCVNGKCVCNSGMDLTKSGKCTPTEGHTVCRDLGGKCEGALGAPGDPPCKDNGVVYQTTGAVASGCNDAQHENCCIPTCNGKTIGEAGFICIRPQDGCAPPVCVGGTTFDCPAGTTKSAPGGGCGG